MTYHIKLQGLVKDDGSTRLARGWRWEGRPVKPESIDRLAATEKQHLDRDGGRRIAAARVEGGRRADPPHGPQDLAHPPGRAVVRGTADGRLARSRRKPRSPTCAAARALPDPDPLWNRASNAVRAHAPAFACDRNQSVAEGKVAKISRALISVSDKTGVVELGAGLSAAGLEILSTGGTARALAAAGVPVREVGDYTGAPEILDGRVKTLHPRIHGGILGRPTAAHRAEMQAGTASSPDRSRGREPLPVPRDRRARRRPFDEVDREHRHRRAVDDPLGGQEPRARRGGRRSRRLRGVLAELDAAGEVSGARRASGWRARRSPTPPPTTARSPSHLGASSRRPRRRRADFPETLQLGG